MSPLSMKDLMKTAISAPIAAAVKNPVVPAGKYLAEKPRLQFTVGIGSKDSNNPGKPYGRLDMHFDVTDPKLEELDLPITPVRWQGLNASWGTGAGALDFQYLYNPNTNEKVFVGLDLSKNGNLSKVLGRMGYAWGLAQGSLDAPIFIPDGEIAEAFYMGEDYLKALSTINGTPEERSEMMFTAKGDPVDPSDKEMYPFVIAQHQIVSVQSLIAKYNKQNPLTFRLTLTVVHDEYAGGEVNRVTGVALLVGENEARLL